MSEKGEGTQLTTGELLALVQRVTQYVNADDPRAVSKRAFDVARAPAGAAGCPTARNLCRRFKSSWPDLLDNASRGPTAMKTALIRDATRTPGGQGVDFDTAVAALALIAARLNVRTLRPDTYRRARNELIDTARGDRRFSLELRLPSYEQFRAVGDWDALLAAAGLEHRPASWTRRREPAVTIEDAIELFLTAMGYLPRRTQMQQFAKERGFALQTIPPSDYPAAHERVRTRRAAKGEWTPARAPGVAEKPPWIPQVPASDDGLPAQQRRDHWNINLVRAGMRRALTKLEPGQNFTERTLRALAQQDPDIPTASVVTKVTKQHGHTFGSLRDEILKEGRQPQTDSPKLG